MSELISQPASADLEADSWTVGGVELTSRVPLGTSRYPSLQTLLDSVEASHAQVVTVSVRRVDLEASADRQTLPGALRSMERGLDLLPNTAGCYTAKEAVSTAQLAREALETNWVKLEVIGDDETLYPDAVQLLKAASDLVADGFEVFAYCGDDPITARKLADLGRAAVMPLAAPIGSGMGWSTRMRSASSARSCPTFPGGGRRNRHRIRRGSGDGTRLRRRLLKTAVSGAEHPALMASAIRHAVEGGRSARRAGRIPRRLYAQASTPAGGRVEVDE